MKGIYKLESGSKVPADIHRMYGTHGPYLMGDRRLDTLTNVTVLVDASTTTSRQTGTQSTKTDTSSAVGRAVVGGILTGGAGAIVGGATAKKNTTISSSTSQQLHTNLTVELRFLDAGPVHVIITELSSYHWLLEQLECTPATTEQLKEMEAEAKSQLEHDREEECRWKQVDETFNDRKPWSRANLLIGIMLAAATAGVISGLMYGSTFISKIFFAVVFGIVLGIVGVLLSVLIESIVGSDPEAERKYKEKRAAVYSKLFPK